MKKMILLFIGSLFCVYLISGCNELADKNPSNEEIGVQPPGWTMGVGFYAFNLFPFSESLNKADSAGVKFVEGSAPCLLNFASKSPPLYLYSSGTFTTREEGDKSFTAKLRIVHKIITCSINGTFTSY